MGYIKGQYVRHITRPEWGVGEIVAITEDRKIKIYFQAAGLKTLSVDRAKLEVVENNVPTHSINIRMRLSVPAEEARRLIDQIPHSTCTDAAPQRWHAHDDGTVEDESVNWLYCWAKTGMGSPNAAEAAR